MKKFSIWSRKWKFRRRLNFVLLLIFFSLSLLHEYLIHKTWMCFITVYVCWWDSLQTACETDRPMRLDNSTVKFMVIEEALYLHAKIKLIEIQTVSPTKWSANRRAFQNHENKHVLDRRKTNFFIFAIVTIKAGLKVNVLNSTKPRNVLWILNQYSKWKFSHIRYEKHWAFWRFSNKLFTSVKK